MVYSLGRTYALRQTLATRVLMFTPVLLFGVGLVGGTTVLVTHWPIFPGVVIIFLILVAVLSSQSLRLPHTIEWSSEGTITFRSYLGSTIASPHEIVSIEPVPYTLGILVIRCGNKKLKLLSQFDGFHEFLHRLKTENPAVELRGC